MYLGSWDIEDYLAFVVNTHKASDGSAYDASADPSYRVYENIVSTPLLTGTMLKLDDANTVGFYIKRIQLTSGNGFERGKTYTIYVSATVDSITGTMSHSFQIGAAVNATQIEGSDATDQINAACDAAIETYRLDELMTAALASQPTAESLFGDLTENDGGTQRFTANAVENVWSVGTRTLTSFGTLIADIWHHLLTGITTAGSIGKLIKDYLDAAITSRSSHTAAQAGTDAASKVLETPAQKVVTDASGRVDVGAIYSNATAAETLAAAAETIAKGKAVGGTLTTTQMTTDLTEDRDDHFQGRQLVWRPPAALAREATEITGYVGSTKKLQYEAVTVAPEVDDEFVIV